MTRHELPDDVVNVMVCSPSGDATVSGWAPTVTADTRLLVVSYFRSAEAYAAAVRAHSGVDPSAFVVIEARRDPTQTAPDGVDLRTESPERLTGVGIQTNEVLTRWRGADAPVVVAFDSVTALLQQAELDVVYRFLHPFAGQVRSAGGRAFYHFADEAHDTATISTLEQLFDTFITVDSETDSYHVQPSAFA